MHDQRDWRHHPCHPLVGGRFDEARAVLQIVESKDLGITGRLIGRWMERRERAPMRYRM